MRFFLLFFGFLLVNFLPNYSYPNDPTYRIARDPSWYPLNLMGQGQAIYGFTSDLIKEIARKEQISVDLVISDWNLLFQLLDRGSYDAVVSSLTPNNINLAKYDFSEFLLALGPVLIVPVNSPISSLEDLQKKIVGVIGSTSDDLIVQKIPNVLIKRYERPAFALEDLIVGNMDGLLLAVLEAQAFIKDLYAGQLKIVTSPLSDQALRLITLKNENSRLIEAVNEGLQSSLQDGTYLQLLKKWNLDL